MTLCNMAIGRRRARMGFVAVDDTTIDYQVRPFVLAQGRCLGKRLPLCWRTLKSPTTVRTDRVELRGDQIRRR